MEIKKIILITGAPGTGKTVLRTDLMDALCLSNSVYVRQRDLGEWRLFVKPETEAIHSELAYTDMHRNLLSLAVLTPYLGKPTKFKLGFPKPFTIKPVFIITSPIAYELSTIQKRNVANIHIGPYTDLNAWRTQIKGMGIEELIAFINKI